MKEQECLRMEKINTDYKLNDKFELENLIGLSFSGCPNCDLAPISNKW